MMKMPAIIGPFCGKRCAYLRNISNKYHLSPDRAPFGAKATQSRSRERHGRPVDMATARKLRRASWRVLWRHM